MGTGRVLKYVLFCIFQKNRLKIIIIFFQIRVQSMRQYMPTLTIYEIQAMGESRILGTFQFPETKFIAVTAYQVNYEKTATRPRRALFFSLNINFLTSRVNL